MVADNLGEVDLGDEPDDDEDDAAGRDLVGHVLVPLEVVGVDGVACGFRPLVKVLVFPGNNKWSLFMILSLY